MKTTMARIHRGFGTAEVGNLCEPWSVEASSFNWDFMLHSHSLKLYHKFMLHSLTLHFTTNGAKRTAHVNRHRGM